MCPRWWGESGNWFQSNFSKESSHVDKTQLELSALRSLEVLIGFIRGGIANDLS